METFDFTSVPGIGKIMSMTGINDGWIVISIILFVLALLFLVCWIASASKGRAARKELDRTRSEMLGLQALVNLPPLVDESWEYAEGADPGSSLVYASARELKRRREMANPKPAAKKQASKAAPAEQAPVEEEAAMTAQSSVSPSVTAQVHKAIFASVTNSHKQLEEEDAPKSSSTTRKRKANGAFITSSDLPPIHVDTSGKIKPGKVEKKPKENTDASLSSRIPRL